MRMNLRRPVSACFSISIFLLVITTRISRTPGLSVSEESNYFLVENEYYRAKLSKSQLGVSEFYVKPQTSINVVSTAVAILGGHELNSYNPSMPKREGVGQWDAGEADSVSLTKLVETEDFVTFRGFMDWGDKAGALPFNLIEYHTFYAEKPYYLVTYTRTYKDDFGQIYDDQCCFFHSPSTFWSDPDLGDGGSWYSINATGHVVRGLRYKMYLHESMIFGKYPFVWVFNTTMNVGCGTILLDAYPRSYTVSLGCWYGGTEEIGYTEYQISTSTAQSGARANESITVTYLVVVDDTIDYTYIDNLSASLFSNHSELVSEIYKPLISMPSKVDTSSSFGSDGDECQVRSVSNEFGLNGYYCANTYSPLNFYLVNETGTYSVWSWESVCITNHHHNDTYAMVQWEMNRYGLNWTVKWETCRNSDTIMGSFDIEVMSTRNITDLYIKHRAGASGITFKTTSDPSYIKLNASDQFNPSIQDEGWMIRNLTNVQRTATGTYFIKWYLLNNDSPQEYLDETHWNATFHFQYFKQYDYENLKHFAPSDFNDPAEGNSQITRFNKRYWATFPLFDQQYNMRIASYSHTKSQISYSEFSDDGNALTLTIVGDSGDTSTFRVYCGDKGGPIAIYITDGALTWSHNASTTILTLNVTHESPTRILIYWKFPGDVNDDEIVDVHDLNRMGKAYGATPSSLNWDEVCDINGDETIDSHDLTICIENYGKSQ